MPMLRVRLVPLSFWAFFVSFQFCLTLAAAWIAAEKCDLTGRGIGSCREPRKYDFDMWVSAMQMGVHFDFV
jgi:hypothetical protein